MSSAALDSVKYTLPSELPSHTATGASAKVTSVVLGGDNKPLQDGTISGAGLGIQLSDEMVVSEINPYSQLKGKVELGDTLVGINGTLLPNVDGIDGGIDTPQHLLQWMRNMQHANSRCNLNWNSIKKDEFRTLLQTQGMQVMKMHRGRDLGGVNWICAMSSSAPRVLFMDRDSKTFILGKSHDRTSSAAKIFSVYEVTSIARVNETSIEIRSFASGDTNSKPECVVIKVETAAKADELAKSMHKVVQEEQTTSETILLGAFDSNVQGESRGPARQYTQAR